MRHTNKKLCRECAEKDYCIKLCSEADIQEGLSKVDKKESKPLIIKETREGKQCKHEGCKHKEFVGGFCEFHSGGDVKRHRPNVKTETCIVIGCSEPTESHKGRGNMCNLHHKERKAYIRRNADNIMIKHGLCSE